MKIPVIEVNQPIGTFYLASLNAGFLLSRLTVNPRRPQEQGNTGIQRRLSEKRVKEIANYTTDPDATFPTAIILNIDRGACNARIENSFLTFDANSFQAEIIDGQHRIFGLRQSEASNAFELPLVLLFDLTEEEKAYIFSTINGNQQKVDRSLVYDLFGLSDSRSPYKTAHEIARTMNSDSDSPLKSRLKMLGRMTTGEETLSQGAFVNYLIDLISKSPQTDLVDEKKGKQLSDDEKYPFRYYYLNKQDEYILKILVNYFRSFAETFDEEWDNSNKYMLSRSTGFGGMMIALREIAEKGLSDKTLTYKYFKEIAEKLRDNLKHTGVQLTTKEFPSNIQQQRRFSKLILQAMKG
jgi:DGQHR domain-containing protein